MANPLELITSSTEQESPLKLHFGNLSKSVTDAELKDLVTPFGAPTSLEIVKDHAGVSKGFAFVEFENAEQGRAAISALDGKEISGQVVKIGEARPRRGDKPVSAQV
jgi:cold-inducible RNA-binding protein